MSRINLSQTLLGALCSLGLCAMAYAADHIDGPRIIGDPPADITDVFAELCGKVGDGDLRGGGVSWRC